jgi:hypothetical protein
LPNNNALPFILQFSIINFFSILMAYFHWPYEIQKDLAYDEQKHRNSHVQVDGMDFVDSGGSNH